MILYIKHSSFTVKAPYFLLIFSNTVLFKKKHEESIRENVTDLEE